MNACRTCGWLAIESILFATTMDDLSSGFFCRTKSRHAAANSSSLDLTDMQKTVRLSSAIFNCPERSHGAAFRLSTSQPARPGFRLPIGNTYVPTFCAMLLGSIGGRGIFWRKPLRTAVKARSVEPIDAGTRHFLPSGRCPVTPQDASCRSSFLVEPSGCFPHRGARR